MEGFVQHANQRAPLEAAISILKDERNWEDAYSEMHVRMKQGQDSAQLTLVRRGNEVCLHGFTFGEQPPGRISVGVVSAAGSHEVFITDGVVSYPRRYFIPLEMATAVLGAFIASADLSALIGWERGLDGLMFSYD